MTTTCCSHNNDNDVTPQAVVSPENLHIMATLFCAARAAHSLQLSFPNTLPLLMRAGGYNISLLLQLIGAALLIKSAMPHM